MNWSGERFHNLIFECPTLCVRLPVYQPDWQCSEIRPIIFQPHARDCFRVLVVRTFQSAQCLICSSFEFCTKVRECAGTQARRYLPDAAIQATPQSVSGYLGEFTVLDFQTTMAWDGDERRAKFAFGSMADQDLVSFICRLSWLFLRPSILVLRPIVGNPFAAQRTFLTKDMDLKSRGIRPETSYSGRSGGFLLCLASHSTPAKFSCAMLMLSK